MPVPLSYGLESERWPCTDGLMGKTLRWITRGDVRKSSTKALSVCSYDLLAKPSYVHSSRTSTKLISPSRLRRPSRFVLECIVQQRREKVQ